MKAGAGAESSLDTGPLRSAPVSAPVMRRVNIDLSSGSRRRNEKVFRGAAGLGKTRQMLLISSIFYSFRRMEQIRREGAWDGTRWDMSVRITEGGDGGERDAFREWGRRKGNKDPLAGRGRFL